MFYLYYTSLAHIVTTFGIATSSSVTVSAGCAPNPSSSEMYPSHRRWSGTSASNLPFILALDKQLTERVPHFVSLPGNLHDSGRNLGTFIPCFPLFLFIRVRPGVLVWFWSKGCRLWTRETTSTRLDASTITCFKKCGTNGALPSTTTVVGRRS